MSASNIQVVIVDEHPLTRLGVRAFFKECQGIEVGGEATNGKEALQVIGCASTDVVLVELMIEGRGGVELISEICRQYPSVRCVAYTVCKEELYAERVLRMGAMGFVMKSEPPGVLVERIRMVVGGHYGVSAAISSTLLESYVGVASKTQRKHIGVERLTNRELQIFEHIGRGQTSQEIAASLHLSVKTVDTYRCHIRRKLGITNGNGLMHAAITYVEQIMLNP